MTTKIIVTNQTALNALYGINTFLVQAAITTLIGSDQRRGIETRVVHLDDEAQMSPLGAPPVTNPTDDAQNKAAIDGVYAALDPDYLAILGSPDIVPMQRLNNPLPGDGDPSVPSDLPHACSGAYSQTITSFLNPTRVVGRITGITGDSDPTALITAINTSSSLQPRSRSSYQSPYLAISAAVWQGSSATSTTHIFGNAGALQLSPPSGPDWSDAQLGCLTHFVNCHGGSNDPKWYGQQGGSYPVAMNASQINGKLPMGVIAAAECCYGGQLYAPGNGTPAICNTYLMNRSAAFCGSSNIAYGPADGQGQADLMTQYFLINMLSGASGGRSLLEARQNFINGRAVLGPSDLKTVGQFNLLGDPSSHPVSAPTAAAAKAMPAVSDVEFESIQRTERRRRLELVGKSLGNTAGWLEAISGAKISTGIGDELARLAHNQGLADWSHEILQEAGGELFMESLRMRKAPQAVFHMLHGRLPSDTSLPSFVLMLAREESGKLTTWEVQYSK